MLRVEPDVKLDFSDVLLKPMRSDLGSRSEVNLEREMYFPHSKRTWKGVPIIVSNMDTTGTIEMALALQKYKVITCLHKYYTKEHLIEVLPQLNKDYFMLSTGIINVEVLSSVRNSNKCSALTPEQCICSLPNSATSSECKALTPPSEWDTFVDLMETVNPHFLCIDVANGYSTKFVEFGKKVRERFPTITLVGGNVTTGDMTQELSLYCGFDIIKCGIGSGCFAADTQVLMADGSQRNINFVQVGEYVLNREGKPVKVLAVTNQGRKEVLNIETTAYGGITHVTPDHRYWVQNIMTGEFEWVPIGEVSNKYMLCTVNQQGEMSYYKLLMKQKTGECAETWDIEVDCPTHSFIANNSIVHNSVCTTRLQTGVGYPQLSAISECAFTSHGCHTHIISDGGIQHVGDFSKAFCAGADFVMSGSMFSAHDECAGETIEENGRKYKVFYGMSSANAMNKYAGGVASYRSAEGKVVKIPYKGPVETTIQNILGGIRSTMTYIGAHNIKDMPKCALFIRVNNQVNTIYNTRENQV